MAYGMFAGGNGTAAAPYLIEDAADLDAIRKNLTANYKLINNINLGVAPYNVGSGWSPINNFSGKFDGNGKKIINLYISRADTDNVGLFGVIAFNSSAVDPFIFDLALENVSVTGRNNAGGLLGLLQWVYDAGQQPPNLIMRVSVTGFVEALSRVGGLIGCVWQSNIPSSSRWGNYNWNTVVTDIITKCDLSSVAATGAERIMGGIIGYGTVVSHYENYYGNTYWAYMGVARCISLCTFKTVDASQIGKTFIGQHPDNAVIPATFFLNCYYDSNLHGGNGLNNGSQALTTKQWFDLGIMDVYKNIIVNNRILYRFRAGRYPTFWFTNQECYFIRAGKDYLTYDADQKKWLKQFDVLQDTPTILSLGMPTLYHIDTQGWNQLRAAYGQVDIVNFVEPTERISLNSIAAILPLTAQNDETMLCYKKEISFESFNDDIISIVP